MEYFILNEHSLPINESNKIDPCLIQFFEVYKIATKCNFKQIRISNNIDSSWYEILVGNNKSLRDWVSEQTSDYSSRLKSLISSTQCPIYDQSQIEEEFRSELSEFSYENLSVPNLGAAHLLAQLSFSLNSSNIWNHPSFLLAHKELTENDNIVEKQANVNNVTTKVHWSNHYTLIEQKQIKAISQSKEIIENLSTHFPNINFTNSAIKQLKNNSFTITFFTEVWVVLKELNNTIERIDSDFNCELIKTKSTLNISDESNTVKQKPMLKKHRLFMYNDERHFFGYHVKNFRNKERIHFIVIENKLIVGYIGKHLPL